MRFMANDENDKAGETAPEQPAKLTRKEANERTRKAILDAGSEVFSEKGFATTRLQDIASRARIGLSTFYGHFRNKDELYHKLIERAGQLFIGNLQAALDETTDPQERDIAAISRAVNFAEANPQMFRIMMKGGKTETKARKMMTEMIASVRRSQYQEGIEAGLFWPNIHPELTSIFETGVVFVVLEWWLDHPDSATKEDVIATLVNLRRFGVERPGGDGPDFL